MAYCSILIAQHANRHIKYYAHSQGRYRSMRIVKGNLTMYTKGPNISILSGLRTVPQPGKSAHHLTSLNHWKRSRKDKVQSGAQHHMTH